MERTMSIFHCVACCEFHDSDTEVCHASPYNDTELICDNCNDMISDARRDEIKQEVAAANEYIQSLRDPVGGGKNRA